MATSDFLQIPDGTQLGITDTSAQFPAWFQAYQQSLLKKGSGIAGADYQTYTQGPRIADFTSDQNKAFGMIRDGVGQIPGITQGALGNLSQIYGQSSLDAANPFYSAAMGSTALGAGSPWLQKAASISPSSAVKGALESAGEAYTGHVDEYMDPYIDQVLNRRADLVNRNLTENIIPQINSTFTGAGQFGSSRQSDFMSRAIRDTQEGLAGTAGDVLSQGYKTSADIYNADKSRLAGTAGTYAGILGDEASRAIQGAGVAGNLAASDASLAGQIGTNAGNLASGDLSRNMNIANMQGGLGQLMLQQLLTGSGALEGIGSQQQGQNQKSLDLQYNDWQNQKDYPLKQLAIMQSLFNGQPIPGSGTTGVTAQPAASTSPLAMLAAMAMGGNSLAGMFGFGNNTKTS